MSREIKGDKMAWYPKAIRTTVGNSSGSYTGGPFKGVLHTTEGSSASGAIGAFKANNSWPHFLIDHTGKVWQFINTNVAARTLRNLSGGAQTNRDSAIQFEITGFAGKPKEHPTVQMDAVRDLMRWVEVTHGVKKKGPEKPFATSYGQNVRYTTAQWDNFDGWCGHCHVPENDHWDPGAIDLAYLLSDGAAPTPTPTPTPTPSDPGFKVPTSYFTEVPQVPFTLTRNQGGFIVVGGDGGVFTYDGAPFKGSLGGITLSSPIIGGAWSSTGEGYWLLGADGAVFGFGDADYSGGFNALPSNVKGDRKPIGIIVSGNGYKVITLDPSSDGSSFDAYAFGA